MLKNRIRIALFCPSLMGGGAERVMVQLANEFKEKDFDVDLVLANAKGAYLSEVSSKVNVIDLKSSRVLTSFPGLVQYIRREKPDVLLSTLVEANVVAAFAKILSQTDVRLFLREANTIHPDRMSLKEKLLFRLMKTAYKTADGFIAISEGVKESLLKNLDIDANTINVIYNPVIHPEIFELAKAEASHSWFEEPNRVVVAVGRLAPQKDYPTLLKAFSKVIPTLNAKLLILGKGPERLEIEKLIRTLGLEDHVQLLGFVKNPFAYMAKADLFVLASAWEGLGNVLIQAMALNTRIVSTDCPSGPAEILEHGRWGTLVPVGDVDALAAALIEALKNEEPVEYPSEALARFNARKVADEYLSFLVPRSEASTVNTSI